MVLGISISAHCSVTVLETIIRVNPSLVSLTLMKHFLFCELYEVWLISIKPLQFILPKTLLWEEWFILVFGFYKYAPLNRRIIIANICVLAIITIEEKLCWCAESLLKWFIYLPWHFKQFNFLCLICYIIHLWLI